MDIIVYFMAAIMVVVFVVLLYESMPKVKNKKRDIKAKFNTMLYELFKDNDPEEIDFFLKAIDENFDKVAKMRDERVSYNQKLKILYEILTLKNIYGDDFAIKHLEYELNRYLEYGLREDNKGLI